MIIIRILFAPLQFLKHLMDATFGRFITLLLSVVIVLVVVLLLTFGNGWSKLLIPNITVYDTRTIINSIKPMGSLVAISHQYAEAGVRVDIRSGIMGACNQWAEYAYVVEIQAGTDLTNIQPSDISYDEETETYTISLSPPQLTSCNVYDNFSRYQFHEPQVRDFICPSMEREFARFGEYVVTESIRDEALTSGILVDAEHENDETLSGFFTAITGKPIVIVYKDIEPNHARSCYPDLPHGWDQNVEENGTIYWTQQY